MKWGKKELPVYLSLIHIQMCIRDSFWLHFTAVHPSPSESRGTYRRSRQQLLESFYRQLILSNKSKSSLSTTIKLFWDYSCCYQFIHLILNYFYLFLSVHAFQLSFIILVMGVIRTSLFVIGIGFLFSFFFSFHTILYQLLSQ